MAVPYDTKTNIHRKKSIVVNALFEQLYGGITGASAKNPSKQAGDKQGTAPKSEQGETSTKRWW